MKNRLRKLLVTITCVISALTLSVETDAFAASSSITWDEDSSGNVFGAGDTVDLSVKGATTIGNEFFGAGRNVKADYVLIDGSAFVAGQNVTAQNSVIEGSLFAAGQDLIISSEIDHNIIAAGQNISTGDSTKAKALYAAVATAEISGTYDYVSVAADTIYFNAEVNGNVKLTGNNIYVGENAVVNGVLTIEYSNEQDINSAASINTLSSSQVENSSDAKEAVAEVAVGAIIIGKIKNLVKNLIQYIVLAIIFAFLFRSNLTKAYEMSTTKAAAYWGFGALTLLAFPIAFIILCITVIGIPVAGLSLAFYILGLALAKVFTYSSLVRELIFRHTKKRLHPVAETVLAVLPAAIINLIPVIHGLVGFACAIYTMGYITLAIADKISSECKKSSN